MDNRDDAKPHLDVESSPPSPPRELRNAYPRDDPDDPLVRNLMSYTSHLSKIDHRPQRRQNWPTLKKITVLSLVCFDYFMFTFITTVTVPTFPALQTKFSATYAEINYSVAVPALALAVSPLVWTPLAKTLGCRAIMISGTVLALVATIGSACAKSYGGYMAARFFQGFGVGPASTVGLQMLQDMFFEHERGEKYGYWTLAIDLGQCCISFQNVNSYSLLLPQVSCLGHS